MDITFTCTNCSQNIAVDVSGAGLQVQCPKCSATLRVPNQPRPSVTTAVASRPANLHDCPDCGRQISKRATSCPQCGAPLLTAASQPVNVLAATCPKCGGTAVQGQLVKMKNVFAGLLAGMLTEDWAAGVLIAQDGKQLVQAFCLSCGTMWLPFRDNLARALRGDFGDHLRDQARRQLDQLVDAGSGFKLCTSEEKEMAKWASSVLTADTHPR